MFSYLAPFLQPNEINARVDNEKTPNGSPGVTEELVVSKEIDVEDNEKVRPTETINIKY